MLQIALVRQRRGFAAWGLGQVPSRGEWCAMMSITTLKSA
jgi:hypothetical protein